MAMLLRFDGGEVRRVRRAAVDAAAAQPWDRAARPMLLLRWQDGLRLEAPGANTEPAWAIGWESWQADLEARADAQWGEGRPILVLAAHNFVACDDHACVAVELALTTSAGPLRFAFLRRV
jgi:hypothetical protein